jgi:glutathione S-transferase
VLLYNSAVSGNCYKVRLLLAHLGIRYEVRELDVVDRSNRRDVLGELNPSLRVPTLVLDDGRPLAESNAILWFFGDGTQHLPEDSYDRARVLQWLFYEQYELEPSLAVIRFWLSYSGRPSALSEDRRGELAAAGECVLRTLDRHLASHDFFVGGSFTIADIALYAYTHVAPEGAFDLDPYAAVSAWLARVAAQPGHVPIDA